MPARVPVTAVLVAHDGSRWLPEALSALAAQTVTPARVVAVDTGSDDDSAALLRRATGDVLELPRTTSYAAAVAAALASVPDDTRWVWLLHDDCAPDPDALSTLLRAAVGSPSAAVLGPKAVDWDDPRLLREIGLTTDGSGVRDRGLEPGELDQGQHDRERDALAVGTAGLLARRDVWNHLGGLDPSLPIRDDLDFGWRVNATGHRVVVVPAARVRHAAAVARGRRPLDSAGAPAAAADRRAALRVTLAHAAGWRVALALPQSLLEGVLRALVLLLGRRPAEAAGELAALLHVLARPLELREARRARAASRTVPPRALRPLMSSPTRRLRARLVGWFDRGAPRAVPTLDEPDPSASASGLRIRPGVILAMTLTGIALLAVRELIGRGVLAGGRLLPAPSSAGELWQRHDDTGDLFLGQLAAVSTVLLGRPALAVDLLLLGCVPLSGVVAYLAAGAVVRSPLLRLWAGATWSLLPVATGAVAAGRLDVAALHVALPSLLRWGSRAAMVDPRHTGWHRAWALGLATAAAVAVAPVLWPLLALLVVGSALLGLAAAAPAHRAAGRRRLLACVLAAAVPGFLLLPWRPSLLSGEALLHGFGRLDAELSDPLLPAWHLLLLQPGGPSTPALVLTAPLLLAALGGLLRTRRARVAAAGWGVALVGLAGALVVARTTTAGVTGWPGVPLQVAAAGMLAAALIGAEGLQASLARSAFGWRQLAAVALVVATAVVPLISAMTWVARGAAKPLDRQPRALLPAYATAELAAVPGLRALLLEPRADGSVAYAVTDASGAELGDERVELDDVVAGLLARTGADAAGAAATRGIAFVALTGDGGGVERDLDAQRGLDRQPSGPAALWRVVPAPRPLPARASDPDGLPVALQPLALLAVAVLAGPGLPRRRGLQREPRR